MLAHRSAVAARITWILVPCSRVHDVTVAHPVFCAGLRRSPDAPLCLAGGPARGSRLRDDLRTPYGQSQPDMCGSPIATALFVRLSLCRPRAQKHTARHRRRSQPKSVSSAETLWRPALSEPTPTSPPPNDHPHAVLPKSAAQSLTPVSRARSLHERRIARACTQRDVYPHRRCWPALYLRSHADHSSGIPRR